MFNISHRILKFLTFNIFWSIVQVYLDIVFDLKGPGGSGAGGGSGGGSSNRWSGLWGLSGAKDSKMDALVHQLDTYSRLGIPRVPHHPHVMAGGSQQLHQNQSFNIQDVEDEVEEGRTMFSNGIRNFCCTTLLQMTTDCLQISKFYQCRKFEKKNLEMCNFLWIHNICMHVWEKTVSWYFHINLWQLNSSKCCRSGMQKNWFRLNFGATHFKAWLRFLSRPKSVSLNLL